MFYRTQRELGGALNIIVDSYWSDKIGEDKLIAAIEYLYVNNISKMIKNNDFTTVIKQQCGKRRLEVVKKILAKELKI